MLIKTGRDGFDHPVPSEITPFGVYRDRRRLLKVMASGAAGAALATWAGREAMAQQVAPPGKHTGGIYESYGRGWLIQPKPEDQQWLKMGEWNTMKIQVNGDEVNTWLNGHPIVYIKDEKIGKGNGFIALQIHDGGGIKVKWRNLVIEEKE